MTTRRRPARRPRFSTLAAYIAKTGDTQEHIAAAVGTTQAHISRISRGEVVPRPDLAVRIATYAGIPLDSFTRARLVRIAERVA